MREIARRIGHDPGTISRELRRNAATRGGKAEYRALVAQWKAQQAAKRPKAAKLAANDRLREYVQERLAGNVRRPDGTIVGGPQPSAWKGLNKPRRADRRWSLARSPEQISRQLKIDFPDDESMRISPEAIYQSLFIESRGALKRELVACLRTGRALREPRERSRNKPQGHVTADVVLSERPAEAADRAVPGHWEGDLIIGSGRSAIGTLIGRSSRSTLLVHLPRLDGWGEQPVVKNGPALGGYGAVAMNAALTASITTLPEQLRKTLTWDRGKELSGHAQLTFDTGTRVFFADPHSPWQRPTNENTNGLLRQYFPKGTDQARWSAEDLEAVALALNNRPRKVVLSWKTPIHAHQRHIRLTTPRNLGNHPVHQRGERPGIPPLREPVVHRPPSTELLRHLPPLAPGTGTARSHPRTAHATAADTDRTARSAKTARPTSTRCHATHAVSHQCSTSPTRAGDAKPNRSQLHRLRDAARWSEELPVRPCSTPRRSSTG